MPVIDLMAGLKEIGSTRSATGGGAANKMVVDVSAPEMKVDLSEPAMAGALAITLANQIRTNILAGCKLDGSPAKPLAQSTIIRREYRRAQGARGAVATHVTNAKGDLVTTLHKGGKASKSIKDSKFKRKVRKHWRERFHAPRVGDFNPANSPAPITTRGVESGLLLASIATEPQADGAWRIFFANVRALTDRTGQAPVGRALGMVAERKAAIAKLVNTPPVRERLEFALAGSINRKSSGVSLLAELRNTADKLRSINEDLQSDG